MLTVESFSAVVHIIQDAATAPEGWKNTLREILEVIGASAGGLMVEGGEGTPDIVANIDADPASLEAYRRYYCRLDPIMPALLKAPEQSVLTQNMVMERSKMMRTEFYNDWLRPQQLDDCLAATVSGDGRAGVLAFAVSARVGYFKADAIQVMQLLAPHVNFAVRVNRQLCGLSLQRNGAVAALDHLSCGVFLSMIWRGSLGRTGRAMHFWPRAMAWQSVEALAWRQPQGREPQCCGVWSAPRLD